MKFFLYTSFLLILTSCSTYRDANKDGFSSVTGGYTDSLLDDGIYRIDTESGVSPHAQKSGVTRVWERRAKALCSGSFVKSEFKVDVIEQKNMTYMNSGLVGYYITKASGYAICSHFSGTNEDALKAIRRPLEISDQERQSRKEKLLNELKECNEPSQMDIDTLEDTGNKFYSNELYKEAIICFLAVYEKDKNNLIKVEVYNRIGLMYELGLGVRVDMGEAMQWYRLGGIL